MQEKIQTERDLLVQLDHPVVMTLHESFEDKHKYYMVTEVLRGSNLFD